MVVKSNWKTRSRQAATFCFLLLALCTVISSARGAAESSRMLQFDVFLGYDGIVPEASWFPVVCEIKNEGPPFKALVELSAGNYNQGQMRRVEVELPTGTLKRLV